MCSETQFCLRWNNFGSTMTSALNTLQQIGDFVDVTLATDGVQLKAHKVVLSACSPYFRDILKSNPCQHPVIILKEVNIEDLESVLTFMYEGEVSVTQLRLHTFMRLAEALQVKGLTESNTHSSSLKQTSQVDSGHSMDTTDSSLSLDLSKKVNRVSSPRRESPVFTSSTTCSKNNYQIRSNSADHVRSQRPTDDHQDLPHANHVSKRRKLSDSGEAISPLSLQSAVDNRVEGKQNMKTVEVKLEPSDTHDEGKEEGNSVMDKNSVTQNEARLPNEPEVSRSPLTEETRQRSGSGSGNSSASPSACFQHSSASEKRGVVVPRVEKQPASYQPEFPQDPSCHHTLPYPCPFCEKSYTSWGFRRRHIKGYHTGTSELPCKWCLAVLPSHQEWESHVTRLHSLTLTDARNGILILEEAHMVLQIAQPTRIDSLMELIKNKKLRDKDTDQREADKGERGSKEERSKDADPPKEREKGKTSQSVTRGEASR